MTLSHCSSSMQVYLIGPTVMRTLESLYVCTPQPVRIVVRNTVSTIYCPLPA